MQQPKIPDYYTDKKLTEQEKTEKDWEMVAKDFPIPTISSDKTEV